MARDLQPQRLPCTVAACAVVSSRLPVGETRDRSRDQPNDSETQSTTCSMFCPDQGRETSARGPPGKGMLTGAVYVFQPDVLPEDNRYGRRGDSVCHIEKVCYIAQLPAGTHNPVGLKNRSRGDRARYSFPLHRPRKTNGFPTLVAGILFSSGGGHNDLAARKSL